MTERFVVGLRSWLMPIVTIVGVGMSAYVGVQAALAELRTEVRVNSARIDQVEKVNDRQDYQIDRLREVPR